jgi:hypothetical protein
LHYSSVVRGGENAKEHVDHQRLRRYLTDYASAIIFTNELKTPQSSSRKNNCNGASQNHHAQLRAEIYQLTNEIILYVRAGFP